jgi:hypothetical protein
MNDINIYEAAYDAAEADCKALRAENDRLVKERDDWKVAFESKTDSNVRRVWKKMTDMALRQRDEAKAENEQLREALEKINGWSEAHPHILGGIGVIARVALAKEVRK